MPNTEPRVVEEDIVNYPDGMIAEHWSRLDGEQHFNSCPKHEDNSFGVHECDGEWPKFRHTKQTDFAIEREHNTWWFCIVSPVRSQSVARIQIDFCPYCGKELEWMGCKCDEIAQSQREDAQLAKAGL